MLRSSRSCQNLCLEKVVLPWKLLTWTRFGWYSNMLATDITSTSYCHEVAEHEDQITDNNYTEPPWRSTALHLRRRCSLFVIFFFYPCSHGCALSTPTEWRSLATAERVSRPRMETWQRSTKQVSIYQISQKFSAIASSRGWNLTAAGAWLLQTPPPPYQWR